MSTLHCARGPAAHTFTDRPLLLLSQVTMSSSKRTTRAALAVTPVTASKRFRAPPPADLVSQAIDAFKAGMEGSISRGADRVMAAVAVCKDATSLTADPTYIGSLDLGFPAVPNSILDEFVFYKALCGEELSIPEVSATLDAEFLTNLRMMDGKLSCVTVKYIGMRTLFSMEGVVDAEDEPDSFLVDFIYNVLKLELATPSSIEAFLATKKLSPFVTGYLLSSEQVDVLIEQGEHEFFEEEAMQDAKDLVEEIVQMNKKKFDLK